MFEPGNKVIDLSWGQGVIHQITDDKDFPVIARFHKYPGYNFYYSQKGIRNDNPNLNDKPDLTKVEG